jgi:3,4-dihydroxy 2-butanone 4-phosphate synthase / GTP cyclohydrolase II
VSRIADDGSGRVGDSVCPVFIEDILEEARAGRMFILVDHENPENEGDLVIQADCADAAAINFIARFGRGLICLAMSASKIDALELSLMTTSNASRHETAFTVSIEAREGVTTGISPQDRATTIACAIAPDGVPSDIATPGQVFPLRARDGGVLVRAGHTEAAVDISRLTGRPAAGVICEIMNEDGTMARLPELRVIAARHGLKIGTISDLISYRQRHDHLVAQTDRRAVTSAHGSDWMLHPRPVWQRAMRCGCCPPAMAPAIFRRSRLCRSPI